MKVLILVQVIRVVVECLGSSGHVVSWRREWEVHSDVSLKTWKNLIE